MPAAITTVDALDTALDTELHMGSEYASARSYLAQRSVGTVKHKSESDPQHGLNDSDFGAGDAEPD